MKVLVSAGGFTPPGGIESYLYNLLPMLTARGHKVCLLCWGPQSRLLDEIAGAGVDVKRQSFRWACRVSAPDLILAARHSLIQALKHDVVVFTKIPPTPILRSLRRISGRGAHCPFIYVTAYRPTEMWRHRRPGTNTLNAFDTIVVQASDFGKELREYGYANLIETIPLIPPRSSLPRPFRNSSDGLKIGFLGRLVPQKNLFYLLEAFAHLIHGRAAPFKIPVNAELNFFGDGPEKPELEAAVQLRGLQSKVRFHGTIPHDAVHNAIDECHLFAFSSISEGQCLAALEILSRGRPIVATPVGAFPEFLSAVELGGLAPLDDAAQFASELHRIGLDLLRRRLTPTMVQQRFNDLFPRDEIIDKYCELFSGGSRRGYSSRVLGPLGNRAGRPLH